MGLQKKETKIIKEDEFQSTFISSKSLVQSSTITFASYDFTLTQSKILAQIIEELQFYIKEAITNEKNRINREPSIFSDKDFVDENDPTVIRFRISLSKLSSSCMNYRNVKAAAYAMSTIPVEIPYYDKNGQPWKEISSLCKVRFPEKKQISEIEIVINRETAKYLLDVKTKGYTEYLKEVIDNSKNQYTPRLYMLLCAYVKRKAIVNITMKDLRKLLKLESKYKVYRDFENRVLKPALEDLKKQAEDNISDFYFTYEKGYKEGKRRAGEPDFIIFTINQVTTEEEVDEDLLLKRKYIFDLLRSEHFMMEEKKALDLCERITDENKMTVLEKIMELSETFRKNKNITNRSQYAFKSLNNILEQSKN